jgi:hypothetical protein
MCERLRSIAAPMSWPVWRKVELFRNQLNGVVGQWLASEDQHLRVWHIKLKPGERLPFHRHVLNYC